ncbi:hypothetical protein O3635_08415 [Rothia mucilaginosa]|uniref:hypothetical protein n=1 Tax=Rothia mucilaginosa TaxID=43675 RepID=UPI00114CB7BB
MSFEARTVLPPEEFSPFPCVDVFEEELASGCMKIFSQTCTEFGLLALHSEYDANSPSTLNAYVELASVAIKANAMILLVDLIFTLPPN